MPVQTSISTKKVQTTLPLFGLYDEDNLFDFYDDINEYDEKTVTKDDKPNSKSSIIQFSKLNCFIFSLLFSFLKNFFSYQFF